MDNWKTYYNIKTIHTIEVTDENSMEVSILLGSSFSIGRHLVIDDNNRLLETFETKEQYDTFIDKLVNKDSFIEDVNTSAIEENRKHVNKVLTIFKNATIKANSRNNDIDRDKIKISSITIKFGDSVTVIFYYGGNIGIITYSFSDIKNREKLIYITALEIEKAYINETMK